MTLRTWWTVAVLAAFVSLLACGGGDGSSGNDTASPTDTAAQDTATPADTATHADTATPADVAATDTPVEAETHATPQAPALTNAHPGWQKAACLSCHTYDDHNDGSDPYLCAGCHGVNGAPNPPHDDRTNCDCHGTPHGAEGFPAPLSCKACHFPQ